MRGGGGVKGRLELFWKFIRFGYVSSSNIYFPFPLHPIHSGISNIIDHALSKCSNFPPKLYDWSWKFDRESYMPVLSCLGELHLYCTVYWCSIKLLPLSECGLELTPQETPRWTFLDRGESPCGEGCCCDGFIRGNISFRWQPIDASKVSVKAFYFQGASPFSVHLTLCQTNFLGEL